MSGARTRHKIEEARFFLGKMRNIQDEAARRIDQELPLISEFIYYLSAFISSARSVPWVMRHEYCDVPGWERWYESEEQLKEEQELLAVFRIMRNVNEKRGDLSTMTAIYPTIILQQVSDSDIESQNLDHCGKPRYCITIGSEGDPDGCTRIDAYAAFELHSPVFGNHDVVATCDRYFRILDLLVRKCERQFGVGSTFPE